MSLPVLKLKVLLIGKCYVIDSIQLADHDQSPFVFSLFLSLFDCFVLNGLSILERRIDAGWIA